MSSERHLSSDQFIRQRLVAAFCDIRHELTNRLSVDKRDTMIFSADPHVESDPLGADREVRAKLSSL